MTTRGPSPTATVGAVDAVIFDVVNLRSGDDATPVAMQDVDESRL